MTPEAARKREMEEGLEEEIDTLDLVMWTEAMPGGYVDRRWTIAGYLDRSRTWKSCGQKLDLKVMGMQAGLEGD